MYSFGAGQKVLIVDDEIAIADSLGMIFRLRGSRLESLTPQKKQS